MYDVTAYEIYATIIVVGWSKQDLTLTSLVKVLFIYLFILFWGGG